MIWRLGNTASQPSEMSVEKRPYPSAFRDNNITVIVIDDDDDEPPRKRPRSITPAPNGILKNSAKRIPPATGVVSIPSSPEPTSRKINSSAAVVEIKKSSPWKSRPSWTRQSGGDISSSDELNDNEEDFAQWLITGTKKPSRWTEKDSTRMQELSVSTASQNRNPHTPSGDGNPHIIDVKDDQLLDKFKFGTISALKFNPNSKTPLEVPTGSKDSIRTLPPVSNHSHPTLSSYTPSLAPQYKRATQQVVHSVSVPKLSPQHSILAPPDSQLSQQSQQQFRFVNIPLPESTRQLRERRIFQEKLKQGQQGVEYARRNSELVIKSLGLKDVSIHVPPDLDQQKCKLAAQPKKRSINRKDISLDIGRLCLNDSRNSDDMRNDRVGHSGDLIHPATQASAVLTNRFAEHFKAPLTFSNEINEKRLNGKFQFVSDYVFGHGVKSTGHVGKSACKCTVTGVTRQGHCNASCHCLQRKFKLDKSKHEYIEQVEQYERLPNGLVVLRDDFIKRNMIDMTQDENEEMDDKHRLGPQRIEISECNDLCTCDDSCINRVVQKGRTTPLDIFETGRCGFGVRSPVDLVRGQFIENYLGEVITHAELERREDAAEAGSTSYIYSLDWFSKQHPYHVDGQNFGSAMRFVNHSCDPNAGTFVVLNNKATKQLHQVAFFALKDIPAGTEIRIDYSPQDIGVVYPLKDADEGMEKCYCGAENCRQMLWPPRRRGQNTQKNCRHQR